MFILFCSTQFFLQNRAHTSSQSLIKWIKRIKITPPSLSDHCAFKIKNDHRSNHRKFRSLWKINNILLNKKLVTVEIKAEIKQFLKINDKSCTTQQNLWYTMKTVVRGNSFVLNVHIRKTEWAQISNLIKNLKLLKKQQQSRATMKLRMEVIRTRVAINKIEIK